MLSEIFSPAFALESKRSVIQHLTADHRDPTVTELTDKQTKCYRKQQHKQQTYYFFHNPSPTRKSGHAKRRQTGFQAALHSTANGTANLISIRIARHSRRHGKPHSPWLFLTRVGGNIRRKSGKQKIFKKRFGLHLQELRQGGPAPWLHLTQSLSLLPLLAPRGYQPRRQGK